MTLSTNDETASRTTVPAEMILLPLRPLVAPGDIGLREVALPGPPTTRAPSYIELVARGDHLTHGTDIGIVVENARGDTTLYRPSFFPPSVRDTPWPAGTSWLLVSPVAGDSLPTMGGDDSLGVQLDPRGGVITLFAGDARSGIVDQVVYGNRGGAGYPPPGGSVRLAEDGRHRAAAERAPRSSQGDVPAPDVCADDLYEYGGFGLQTSRSDSLDYTYDCRCPTGGVHLVWNRQTGRQFVDCFGGSGKLTTSDYLELRGTAPGYPFAFETRLLCNGVSNHAEQFLGSFGYWSSRVSAALRVGEPPAVSWERPSSPGRRAAGYGRRVRLASGLPGEIIPLTIVSQAYADNGTHGGTTSRIESRLSFMGIPAGAELSPCRALPLPPAAPLRPRPAYAEFRAGSLSLTWSDCAPGHDYRVDRGIEGAWNPWRVVTPDPASDINVSAVEDLGTEEFGYRLVVDGTPLGVVHPPLEGASPPPMVSSAAARWAGDRVALRWVTALPGESYACERQGDPAGTWTTWQTGVVPATGVIELEDRDTHGGATYGYRLRLGLRQPVGLVTVEVPALPLELALSSGTEIGRLVAHIILAGEGAGQLRLFDVGGHLRESHELPAGASSSLDVEFGRRVRLPAGIYFARLEQAGRVAVARGVVVR